MDVVVNNWKTLADALITTDELDPVYPFAVRVGEKNGKSFLNRFMLSFLMLYDLNSSLLVAESTSDGDYWDFVEANYKKLPVGKERRHFRGELAAKYLSHLKLKGSPDVFWTRLYQPTYTNLYLHVQVEYEKCGIGPYFTWKLMDFYDRIFGKPVRLTQEEADKYLPPEPRKASKLSGVSLEEVKDYISKYKAPGIPNRNCGYPEAETVLCAIKGLWYSYSYNLGDDIKRRHRELSPHFRDYVSLLPDILENKYAVSSSMES